MTLPSRSQDYGLLDSSILMEAESEWKRAALTLHFPWAWDQASAVYCIFHFSGGVFSLARPPRNHRLPWAMVAGWVSKKNAKKAGDNRRKNGSPLPICQSTAVTQRERERDGVSDRFVFASCDQKKQ